MTFRLPGLCLTTRAVMVLAMLAVGLAVLLAGALPASAQGAEPQRVPDAPDKPTGKAIYAGMVDLEWNDLPEATSYDVQFYWDGAWNDLPGNGVDISFYGAGAILRNLPEQGVYHFQVRARNALGPSDWSEYLFMEATATQNWDDVPEPTNTPATGVPTISGKAEVSETLAASISDIEDENGLDRVKFSYQWTSGDRTADSDIEGATGATYTLRSDDAGKAIKVRVSFTDRGGYAESLTSSPIKVDGEAEAQADNEAPTVSSIAITSYNWEDDGVYGIGDSIEVTVAFSAAVTVTGIPRLELDVGGSAKAAEYKSTDGNNLKFSYTVAENDEDTNGVSIEADKLTLNDGSIKDSADNDANLSHNALPAQEDHRVDGVRPTIWRISLSSARDGGFSDLKTVGTEILVRVKFTESTRTSGRPQLTLDFDGTAKTSEWGWLGRFSYAIQEGDEDTDGVAIGANAISLNGGTIRDGAGNDAVLTHGAVAADSHIKVDAVAPTVSSIAITSDPGEDDTYDTGDQIEVTVTFSEVLEISRVTGGGMPDQGWPQLELDIGGGAKTAEYQSLSGAEVVFDYTVQDGDTDENGIAIGANKLSLNDGPIRDRAGNLPMGAGIDFIAVAHDAVVSHDAVADDAGHKVAGTSSLLTLSGDTSPEYEENGERRPVATYRVSDSDAAVTWSLSGDDSGQFSISGGSRRGRLSFISPPNYEDPTDADTDNRYRVTIQASDGTNEAKLQVTVVVTNVGLDADELPTVAGTAQVGETLTADTSLISVDPDYAGPSYFWLRSDGTTDTEIEGARLSSSYTLVAADEGHTIKVRVNFRVNYYTAPNGFVSLTSEPTAVVAANPNSPANSPATGAPAINGAAYVGNTLTADTSGISDADGLTNETFSYRWIRNDRTTDADISGATGATYTLVAADEGKNIKVRVSFTDDAGNQESLTSVPLATVAVRATPLTGLTVNPGTLAPAFHDFTFYYAVPDVANSDRRITVNATVKHGYKYEIAPVEGEIGVVMRGWSPSGWRIAYGANNTFEPLTDADADSPGFQMDLDEGENYFGLRVYQGVDDLGEFYWLTITRESADATLSGLTLSGVNFGNFDPATTGYAASVANDVDETTVTPTVNDGGATYTIQLGGEADADGIIPLRVGANVITVEVTAGDGNTVKTYTVTVTRASNSPATGAPAISGTAQVGETLTADTSGIADADGLTGATFKYQWLSSRDTDILGATGSTYTLVSADVGKTIKVRVSFTDDAGHEETLTSSATPTATATPGDTPSANLRAIWTNSPWPHTVGRPISVRVSLNWDTPDGYGITTYVAQMYEPNGDEFGLPLTGATIVGETQRLGSGELWIQPDTAYEYVLTLRNAANETIVEEDVTVIVHSNAENPATEAPTNLKASLVSDGSSVVLSWDAPEGNLWRYEVIRDWRLNGAVAATQNYVVNKKYTAYTDTNIGASSGRTYEYRVRAVTGFYTSYDSEVVSIQIPSPSASSDATLSSLTLSGIAFGTFASGTYSYSAQVGNSVSQTTVTPTTNDDGATYVVKLGGVTDDDSVIPLAVGKNVITIKVTAEDGQTSKTYTITVTRAAPPAPGPAVAVEFSPSGSVDEGTEIALTMSFANLESNSDTSDTDYVFRADVVDADACEGGGMGKDRYMYKVDEEPEVRTGTVSASCAPGDYTVQVSISSPGNVELASATADFTVAAPGQQPEPPASTDATLSGLTLSGVDFGAFDPATTGYTASVSNDVDETTVTPTTNDDGATYMVKLDGVADDDGVISLSVGSNTITVEVTAEDGQAVKTYTVTVTRAGTTAPTDQSKPTAPTISSIAITSSPNDDAVIIVDGEREKVGDWRVYGIDDSIEVTVAFSAGVTVTGVPRLELDVGGSAKAAEYKSTHGNNLKFSYTVAENDEDTDGVSIRANKLTLNGGTIRGAASQDADLSHATLAPQSKHKVDGIRPSFRSISFSGSNTHTLNGYYNEGEEVFIKVRFSEGRIYVSGTPKLTIDVGGKEKKAELERTGFGDYFFYTVQEGDLDLDGPSFSANSVSMNGGYIRDGAGNDIKLNHGGASAGLNSRIDAVVPTVSAVAITSDPGADDTYAAGDTVEVSVTFSEEVRVPDVTRSDLPGTRHPVLDLRIGNDTRSAKSGLQELGRDVKFTYTIQSGDTDTDGISINANGLRLNGGIIFDAAGNNPISARIHNFFDIPLEAVVPHDGLADDPGHKVAAGASTPNSPATGAPTISGTAQVGQTLTASTSGISDADGLTNVSYRYRWLADGTKIEGARSSTYTLQSSDVGKVIKVRVTFTDDAGNKERLKSAGTAAVATRLSTDATLSGLSLSGVNIGAFDPATTGYTASVANDVTQTTVIPTTNDDGASYVVKLDGVADADRVIPLAVGSNVITIEVTAEDSNTVKTYTVTVTRDAPPAPGPAVAVELSPSGSVDEGTEIALTMSFANLESDSDTSDTDYIFRADVVNADACEGGGMGLDRYMYKVDEDPEVRAGTISASCAPGDYTVEVSISSPGNVALASATADFTVAAPAEQQQAQEPPPSTDATLSSLVLSDVTLAFASSTTEYAASVANDVDETTVTPTTNDDGATYVVKLDGVADDDSVVPLSVGSNTITIEVTAEDGNATQTYTVTVTRAAPLSTDATLSGLILSGIDLGAFDSATTGYTASVANDVDETTVTPTTNDDGASYVVKLGGVTDEDGVVPLAVGSNVITIEVTAEDGNTAKTYKVTITRAEPDSEVSTDATLNGLTLRGIDFGAFDSATTGYTASVANDVSQTTVTPTTNDDGATYVVKLSGVTDDDRVIPLAVGANVITVEVTAEDGNTIKTYIVTVTRAAPPSSDATLKSLTLSGVNFGAFDSATTGYTASVANDVDETTVTPTTNDDGATYAIKLGGVADDDGVIPLAVGKNVIAVEVTAEDGQTTKTYAITVTRAGAEPTPDSPPKTPDAPTGKVTGTGQVQLDWNDVEGATYYQVRFFDDDDADWVELPTDEIGLVLDGSSATVSNLPDYGIYFFSVRAGNAAGLSEWSEYLGLPNPEQ